MYIVKLLCNNLRTEFDLDEAFEEIIVKIQSLGICKKVTYNEGEYNVIDPDNMLIMCSFEMEVNLELYKITIHKQTYQKTIDEVLNTIELEIFSLSELTRTLYDLKVKIKDILNSYFKEMFILKDTQNEVLCSKLYLQIHIVENKFRELINKYMLRKYGVQWFKKNIKEEFQKKSNLYVGWYKSKYTDFVNIQSELFNLQTDDLIEMLEKSYINQLSKKVVDSITDLKNELGENASLVFNENVMKLKCIWEMEIKSMLPADIKDIWAEFSKMRNMIAHNKPICLKLEEDINNMVNELNRILQKFEDKIELRITSLEKQEAEAFEEEMYDEIFREEAGIEPLPDRETVIKEITENEDIQTLYYLIEEFTYDYKSAIENFESYISDLDFTTIFADYSVEEFKKNALELYNFLNVCGVNIDEFKTKIIETALSEQIKDIVIQDLNENFATLNFHTDGVVRDERFEENKTIFKYTNVFGETITIETKGEIYPDSGSSNDIDIKVVFNGNVIARGNIERSYGDYDINDEEGYAMPTYSDELYIDIEEIINIIRSHFDSTLVKIKKYEEFILTIIDK